MKRIFVSLILLTYSILSLALTPQDIPNSFFIKEIKHSYGCMNVQTKDKTLATLTVAPNKNGTFNLTDAQDQNLVTAILTRITPLQLDNTLHQFDMYNAEHQLIAKVDFFYNPGDARYRHFTIDTPDGTRLLTASGNLFGTYHAIYKGDSWTVLAGLYRPLFTNSHDSEIKMFDKIKLLSMIDPNILITVLSLYSLPKNYDMSLDPVG